jgi:Na+-transporting NADH:ubiquinone oxidoreductase subunit C
VAKNKDSIANIVVVALSLCLVAAIAVSSIAVGLKPTREANKELDRAKNILIAAGLYEQGKTANSEIDGLFEQFEIRLVDLREGKLLSPSEAEALGIDPVSYEQRKAAKDPAMSRNLETSEDLASISRQADYSVVYLLKTDGDIDRVVIPIHGYGLWSTLYGYIALDSDMNTVSGITFYEHQETAGLGGEVDNPAWKAIWEGKEIYGDSGDVALTVIKGSVDPNNPNAEHQIDGLSGATLTSRGVQNLIQFWMGDAGFGPILKELKG